MANNRNTIVVGIIVMVVGGALLEFIRRLLSIAWTPLSFFLAYAPNYLIKFLSFVRTQLSSELILPMWVILILAGLWIISIAAFSRIFSRKGKGKRQLSEIALEEMDLPALNPEELPPIDSSSTLSNINLMEFQIRFHDKELKDLRFWTIYKDSYRYEREEDGIWGGYLHILPLFPQKDLPHDLRVGRLYQSMGSVRLVVKEGCAGRRYLQVKFHPKEDRSQEKLGWIMLYLDDRPPKWDPHSKEWSVGVTPKRLQNEWLDQLVDIEKVFSATYGTEGWILDYIVIVRLRDEIQILGLQFLDDD